MRAKIGLLKRKKVGDRYVFEDVVFKDNRPMSDPAAAACYIRYSENGKQITKTFGKNLQSAWIEYNNRNMNLERAVSGLPPIPEAAGLLSDFHRNAAAMAPRPEKTGRVWITDAVKKYIDGIKRDVETGTKSRGTLGVYQRAVERLRDHMTELGLKYLDEITGDHLKAHEAWLFKNNKKMARGTAENTIANQFRFLNTFFVENDINMTFRRGESGLIARHKILRQKKKPVVDKYSDDEVNALLSVADVDEADLIYFFLMVGARDEEVQFMEWKDIDWKKGIIHIQEKPGVWKPKDKENRNIPLNRVLRIRLEVRHKRQHPASNLIFPNTLGTRDMNLITKLHKVIRKLQEAGRGEEISGIPTLHRFRRTFATKMIKQSDFPTVMKLTGHSDAKTLMLYLAADDEKKAAVASEAAFEGIGA